MHTTAAHLLSKRAQLTPHREAVLELATGARYTYAQLNERANRAAHWLMGLGVGKGTRVGLLAHNSVIYVDLLYACLKLGAIFVPLNWRLAEPELVYVANDCGCEVLIGGREFAATLSAIQPHLRTVRHLVAAEGANIPATASYEEGLQNASPTEPPIPALEPDDCACILYTSGTTGRPKGALIPHRQILWNAINTAISWELGSGDTAPIFTPMFHSGGLFVFLTPLLYVGGRVVIGRTFDADVALQTIAAERCTVILGVPTLFQLWLNSPALPTADLSHVRWFISGGAPCPPALMDTWRQTTGTVFRQGYGLTEVGTNCFTMTDEESAVLVGSVGKPIFHSEMVLMGQDGRPVSPNETGELLIRGPHVCAGYWGNAQATAEAIRDGWFHTGDMARQDEQGYYYIVGRFKDMIISGGENIYSAEVEAIFREHVAVAEAALIGIPDETWGEVGLMAVQLKQGQTATAEELRAFCQTRLARYKVPKQVIFLDALPISPYGKVEKLVLKELLAVSP